MPIFLGIFYAHIYIFFTKWNIILFNNLHFLLLKSIL